MLNVLSELIEYVLSTVPAFVESVFHKELLKSAFVCSVGAFDVVEYTTVFVLLVIVISFPASSNAFIVMLCSTFSTRSLITYSFTFASNSAISSSPS